jgi:hypothetical protein
MHPARSPVVERTAHAAGAPTAPSAAASLRNLHQQCVALWSTTAATLPWLGPRVSRLHQWGNSRAAAALIDYVTARVADYPLETGARQEWRTEVRRRLLAFGETRLGWPVAYRDVVFDDCFYETAAAFANEARGFDPALSLADLGQALRNVWVGNSLQILVGAPVRLTPALFAYSMLYPATDNVLDAVDVSRPAKRAFNARLGRRLAGEIVAVRTSEERRVWTLLDTIEGEFPRGRYSGVWQSLIDIHRAQHASLEQQQARLSENALLDLTVAKGGASVRADMYVVAGMPSVAAERMAFFYGVSLQMLDDLQDIATDLEAGHDTLFTRAAHTGGLDALTRRLAHFIDRVLELHVPPSTRAAASCAEVIRRNCLMLLAGVVARNPHWFGRNLRREIERQWPVTFGATRRLLRRTQHQLARIRTRTREQYGTESVLDVLLQQ